MVSRLIYIVACISTSYFFIAKLYSIACKCHNLLVHSFVNEILGCFYHADIVSSVAKNYIHLSNSFQLEKEMKTCSSILAWRIPRMEESGRLQFMGSQRVRHNWVTSLSLFFNYLVYTSRNDIAGSCNIYISCFEESLKVFSPSAETFWNPTSNVHLLVICIQCLKRCLFKSFRNILTGLFAFVLLNWRVYFNWIIFLLLLSSFCCWVLCFWFSLSCIQLLWPHRL